MACLHVNYLKPFRVLFVESCECINNAQTIEDLRIPPANRLEMLKGDRSGQFSIRVNDQFRPCFNWLNAQTFDVGIVDYHRGNIMLSNIHPGEVLLEEFLKPMHISQNKLARSICVSPRRINEIIQGKRSITADTAVRLGRYFGTSAKFWLGLQDDYDLEEASKAIDMNQIKIYQAAINY